MPGLTVGRKIYSGTSTSVLVNFTIYSVFWVGWSAGRYVSVTKIDWYPSCPISPLSANRLVTAEGSDAGSHGSDSVSHKGSVDGQADNQVEGGSLSFHNAAGELLCHSKTYWDEDQSRNPRNLAYNEVSIWFCNVCKMIVQAFSLLYKCIYKSLVLWGRITSYLIIGRI